MNHAGILILSNHIEHIFQFLNLDYQMAIDPNQNSEKEIKKGKKNRTVIKTSLYQTHNIDVGFQHYICFFFFRHSSLCALFSICLPFTEIN